jgi:hypothetical protein
MYMKYFYCFGEAFLKGSLKDFYCFGEAFLKGSLKDFLKSFKYTIIL